MLTIVLAPRAQVISLNDPSDPRQAAIFKWLESVVHIVDIPFVSRPAGYSSQTINYLKDPKVSTAAKMALVKPLAEASEASWQAILEMDSTKLGKALSDTMKAWAGMLPYTTDPYLNEDAAKSEQLRAFVAKWAPPRAPAPLLSSHTMLHPSATDASALPRLPPRTRGPPAHASQ